MLAMFIAAVVGTADLAPPEPPVRQSGAWAFERSIDPITDEISARAFATDGHASFGVKCDAVGKPMYVSVIADEYLGQPDTPLSRESTVVRFDHGTPIYGGFRYQGKLANSDAKESTFYINEARTATRVGVKLIDYDGHAHEYFFNLTGASAAINAVTNVCHNF